MIYNAKISNANRQEVLEYIRMKKSEGIFRVVDVGGSYVGWSVPIVDAIIDFNDCVELPSHITHFKCDITNHVGWTVILDYVPEWASLIFVFAHILWKIL